MSLSRAERDYLKSICKENIIFSVFFAPRALFRTSSNLIWHWLLYDLRGSMANRNHLIKICKKRRRERNKNKFRVTSTRAIVHSISLSRIRSTCITNDVQYHFSIHFPCNSSLWLMNRENIQYIWQTKKFHLNKFVNRNLYLRNASSIPLLGMKIPVFDMKIRMSRSKWFAIRTSLSRQHCVSCGLHRVMWFIQQQQIQMEQALLSIFEIWALVPWDVAFTVFRVYKKKSDSNRFHLLDQLKIFTVQYLYRRRGYDVTEFYCMYFLLLSLCEFYFWHICGETDLWWWCGATHEMKYSRPIYVLYNCQYNTIGLLLFRDAMSESQILRNISHIFQFKRNSSFQFLMTWWLSIYSFVSMHKMIDSYAMSHTPQSIQFTQLSVLTL